MDALGRLRELVEVGFHDSSEAYRLAADATSRLADDPRVELLCGKIVELLQVIELEIILGGDYATRQEQLVLLLDWIARQD